ARPPVPPADPPGRHGADHRGRRAAGGRAGADDPVGVGGVGRPGLGGHPAAARARGGGGRGGDRAGWGGGGGGGWGGGREGGLGGAGRSRGRGGGRRRRDRREQVVAGRPAGGDGHDPRAEQGRQRPPAALHPCEDRR